MGLERISYFLTSKNLYSNLKSSECLERGKITSQWFILKICLLWFTKLSFSIPLSDITSRLTIAILLKRNSYKRYQKILETVSTNVYLSNKDFLIRIFSLWLWISKFRISLNLTNGFQKKDSVRILDLLFLNSILTEDLSQTKSWLLGNRALEKPNFQKTCRKFMAYQ